MTVHELQVNVPTPLNKKGPTTVEVAVSSRALMNKRVCPRPKDRVGFTPGNDLHSEGLLAGSIPWVRYSGVTTLPSLRPNIGFTRMHPAPGEIFNTLSDNRDISTPVVATAPSGSKREGWGRGSARVIKRHTQHKGRSLHQTLFQPSARPPPPAPRPPCPTTC